MSWIAIIIILVGLWLAFKAVGVVVRLLIWAVVIAAVYWLVAPHLGLPRLG
ncbi:hypothetical protein [Cognatilysobacter lacus]|uniref:hypothetical protein n=1 Tax=Cognatilysobacter lacus TaxID=1643323 RepID=UPI00165912B1|nr:hypothetical protein [Lysobacter lacus]